MDADAQLLVLVVGLVLIGLAMAVGLVKVINECERLRGRAQRAERLLHYRAPRSHRRVGAGR